MLGLSFSISSHTCARTSANLRNSQLQHPAAHGFRLACGNDHAGIWHGDSDYSHETLEHLVGNGIREIFGRYVVGRTDARHADGMRPHSELCLQMLGVHEQSHEVVAVEVQPEEHPYPNIVDACLHSAVHSFGMVCIVALGSCGVQFLVVFPVVGLLEEYVCSDSCIPEPAVVLHGSGCYVHVHPAYGSILVVYAIDGAYGLQYVFYRIVARVLSCLQCQPLVAHVLQSHHLALYLLLRELAARYCLVLGMIRTIHASVHTIV